MNHIIKKFRVAKVKLEYNKVIENVLCMIGIFEKCIECGSVIHGHSYNICEDCFNRLC